MSILKSFFKKLSYAEQVRRSAITSLTSNQKMSGKMRRSLLRSTGRVIAVGQAKDPVRQKAALDRKVAKATHAQRCKWYSRIPRRIAGVDNAIRRAAASGMDIAVAALKARRQQLDTVRGSIGAFFAMQNYEIAERQKSA